MNALGDLSIIISFMHITSTAISMAPVSRKSGILFTKRSLELEAELDIVKPKADTSDYLVPEGSLLEPHMATGALAALNDFVVEETGAKQGSLYEDIVQDSLKDLETMYADARARLEAANKKTTYVPLPTSSSLPAGDTRVAGRRAKEKTLPAEPSAYTITAPPETPQTIVTELAQHFDVRTATSSLFTTFSDKSEARGSVSWTDFESAMADLGFSVTPKDGSIFTFNPPAEMNTRPITLHRPHVSMRATNYSSLHAGCRGRTGGLSIRSLSLDELAGSGCLMLSYWRSDKTSTHFRRGQDFTCFKLGSECVDTESKG